MSRVLRHVCVGKYRTPKIGRYGKYYTDDEADVEEVYAVLYNDERAFLACTCRGFARGKRQGKPAWERGCKHTRLHARLSPYDLEVWAELWLADLAGKGRVTLDCPDCCRPLNITYEASRFEAHHVACDCGEVWAISELGKTITRMSDWVAAMRRAWLDGRQPAGG